MIKTIVIFTLIKGKEVIEKELQIVNDSSESRNDTIAHMCNKGFWDKDGMYQSPYFIYSAKIK
ncbi:MAG: hypothetical protein WC346_08120 [Methanogenium sp.]|jgi:hypothetical protein